MTIAWASGSSSWPAGGALHVAAVALEQPHAQLALSRAIWRLSVGWVECMARAARLKLRASATATNDLKRSSSIYTRMVILCTHLHEKFRRNGSIPHAAAGTIM